MGSHSNDISTLNAPKKVLVSWPHHNKFFIDGLWSLYREKYKVDVELEINEHANKIHQIVLALFCPSFKPYFHTLGESVIKLDNVSGSSQDIDLLVQFLYTGKIHVEENKLDNLQLAAKNLGVEGLIEAIKRTKSKLVGKTKTVIEAEPESCVASKEEEIQAEKLDAIKAIGIIHKHSECHLEAMKTCPNCPFRHRCQVIFNKHLTRHQVNANSFVCNVCNKTFRSRVGLRQHSLYHGDPNLLFKCTKCSFRTSQKPHWVRHLAVNHKIDPQGKTLSEDVNCSLCSFVTTSRTLLKSHTLQKHSTEKPYKCNECDYSSLRRWDVVKHGRTVHRNERSFMCELCGYTSKTSGNLKNHVNRHLGLKPHKCKVCGQDFSTVSSLKMHLRIHAVGEKPFVCELCGQGFLRRYRLTTHMKQVHQIDMVIDKKYKHLKPPQFSNQQMAVVEQVTDNTIQCLLPDDEAVDTEVAPCIVMQLV